MNKVEKSKKKQISEIVSVVKLSSLLFVGIIICKYIFKDGDVATNTAIAYYTVIFIVLPIFVLVLIYFMWTFSSEGKMKSKYGNIISNIETIVFILFFTGVIYVFVVLMKVNISFYIYL